MYSTYVSTYSQNLDTLLVSLTGQAQLYGGSKMIMGFVNVKEPIRLNQRSMKFYIFESTTIQFLQKKTFYFSFDITF